MSNSSSTTEQENLYNLYVKAISYATEKHKDQKRYDGQPYITHPLAVAQNVTDPKAKIIAILHDILEDTDTTLDSLIDLFGHEIALTVVSLSRIESMSYEDYILGIKVLKIPLARQVKIADLKHNLSTIDNIPDKKQRAKLKHRYEKALEALE